MNQKIFAFVLTIIFTFFEVTSAFATTNNQTSPNNSLQIISRLAGQTRFETAKVISENYGNGNIKAVVLSTGNQFADALSASVLAHAKEAPILLVDSNVDKSKDALDYVKSYLDSTGTIYIIGGTGIIGAEFETKLENLGFNHVIRIAGIDRYETSCKIASSLNEIDASTVVISSGEQYPDALSISSFAANKGWPILLSPHNALPLDIKNFLQESKPSKVYITGGTGVISNNVVSEITSFLPQASIERLMGQSRFDTNAIIAETFAPNPSTIYLATGYDFADALAGSVLAAKNGDPIILVDPFQPTLPKSVASYFAKLFTKMSSPNLVTLGGSGVINDQIIKHSNDLVSGLVRETSIYSIPDITASVKQDKDYSLPSTIQAILYNSDTVDLPVQWNTKLVDTSSVGLRVYDGVVEGFNKIIKLNLTVEEPLPISQYSTYFDPTQVNRTENIRLAAKAIDGKLLAPGERFSFNRVVGERTPDAGYKEAMIIEGNTFTPGLGGGVCQVSSTLFNAVILANLEIIERHHHTLPIDYVPPGQDATVAYPVLDFKFRNSLNAYLLMRSLVEGNTLTFRLYAKAKK